MKKPLFAALLIIATAAFAFHATQVMAQVAITVDTGAAARTKVSTIMTFFLSLVQIAGYSLFVIAIMLAGYKITFVEGYKASDAKGVVVGGIVFGLAASLATYLTT
jgi:hypothetical protein